MNELTLQVVQEGGLRIIEVLQSGPRGARGQQGLSAYEVAVANGFVGTEAEWLDSLQGENTNGGNGSAWLTSSGVPPSNLGQNGDFCLNILNGDIYGPKAAGVWGAVIYNIAEGQSGIDGDDGREVEMRANPTHVQWRYVGEATWIDLIPLSSIKGADGDDGQDGQPIELQVGVTHIQWRVVGSPTWIDLVAISAIKGADGNDGQDGNDGNQIELQTTATHIQWRYVGAPTWTNLVALASLKGDVGPAIELRVNATHIQWRVVGDPTWIDLIALSAIGSGGGSDGREIELQTSATHIQWRYVGDPTWINLVSLASLEGDAGPAIELQVTATHIQWRVVGAPTWINLIALSAIEGTDGNDGREIQLQTTATHIQWRYVGDAAWTNLVTLASLKGDAGPAIELQVTATHIQWRVVGATTWIDLIALSAIEGVDGSSVELQTNATHIQWRAVGSPTWTDLVALASLKGDPGDGTAAAGNTGEVQYRGASGLLASAPGLVIDPATGRLTLASFLARGAAPAAPTTGFVIYANSSNAFSWEGANGFSRTLDGTGNTADRTYALQNKSGTIAHLDDLLSFNPTVIPYAATVTLDMAALSGLYCTVSLAGPLTLTTSNRVAGRFVSLRLVCDATLRALTVPAGWVFLGPPGTKPSNIAASKTASLSLTYYGTADTDCIAAYGVQG